MDSETDAAFKQLADLILDESAKLRVEIDVLNSRLADLKELLDDTRN